MNRDSDYIDDIFAEGLDDMEVIPPHEVWVGVKRRLDFNDRIWNISALTGIAASIALLIGIFVTTKNADYIDSALAINLTPISTPTQTQKTAIAQVSVTKPEIKTNTVNTASISVPKTKLVSKSEPSHRVVASTYTTETVKSKSSTATPRPELAVTEQASSINATTNIETNSENIIADNLVKKDTNFIAESVANQTNQNTDTKALEPTEPSSEEKVAYTAEILKSVQNPANTQPATIKTKINRWSIEGQVAPMYSFREVQKVSTTLPGKSGFNQNEEGMITYTGGLKVSYHTSSRLSIQAGVYYSAMGQTVNAVYQSTSSANNVVISQSTDESTQKIITNTPYGAVTANMSTHSAQTAEAEVVNAKVVQQFKYVELPVLARYKVIDQRISCHLVGGFSTNFLVKNTATFEGASEKTAASATPNVRNVNYSSTLGIGVSYRIFEKLNLSVEPTCKYYLTSMSTNSQIKVYPYALGVFSGLTYSF